MSGIIVISSLKTGEMVSNKRIKVWHVFDGNENTFISPVEYTDFLNLHFISCVLKEKISDLILSVYMHKTTI